MSNYVTKIKTTNSGTTTTSDITDIRNFCPEILVKIKQESEGQQSTFKTQGTIIASSYASDTTDTELDIIKYIKAYREKFKIYPHIKVKVEYYNEEGLNFETVCDMATRKSEAIAPGNANDPERIMIQGKCIADVIVSQSEETKAINSIQETQACIKLRFDKSTGDKFIFNRDFDSCIVLLISTIIPKGEITSVAMEVEKQSGWTVVNDSKDEYRQLAVLPML